MACKLLSVFRMALLALAFVFRGDAVHLRRSSQAPLDFRARTSHRAQVALELYAGDAYMHAQHQALKDEKSPWKAAEQGDESDRNICLRGKQVPDFYVLGVQKCATTTLAENLMGAGMVNVHGDLNPKEFHWFDHRMDYSLIGEEGYEQNKNSWLSWMPDCLEGDADGALKRRVLADFTPDYFRVVPRPESFAYASPRDWMKFQELDIHGPKKMYRIYGAEQAKKLQFALMFREPLAQMQSAWYHAASFNFTNACKSCRAESFKAALEANLNAMKESPPQLTPWQWTTMYARQMEPWLEYFNASQFYIIPMHQLSGENKDEICKDLSKRLSFGVDCDSQGVESLHSWSHEHPPVDEDAGEEMRKAFDEFMAEDNKHLAHLLAKASLEGMGLANYLGEKGDEDAIYKWLTESW